VRSRFIRPTLLTWIALTGTLSIIAATAGFLIAYYPNLPDILPVHFNRVNRPNGWQYKTYTRVLMPVLVQTMMSLTFGAVGALLLAREHRAEDATAEDMVAASVSTEAISLVALIWVAFQAYAGAALVFMWERERGGLGNSYTLLLSIGILLSVAVALRARKRLGRPAPREFVASHWRLGQLYRNPADPALFVPTRDGSRWTLNFGRPVAAALIGGVLLVGIVGPTLILGLLLR
jgi:uncharacterized membrane protein